MRKLLTVGMLTVMLACGAGPVKQEKPPSLDAFKDEGPDMQGEAEKGPEPKILTVDDRKQLCCEACSKAFENDRKGDPADKVPCTDYTADLDETCLKWFRKNPITAAEALQCRGKADAAKPEAPPANE